MKVNKVALCLITRLENKYIREYVQHYQSLGFDKIFLYDNNRPGEENPIDELQDYVDSGLVEIIRWMDFSRKAQRTSYQDCWDKHQNEYDWIAFFDADEYLILNTTSDIHEFLSNEIYDGNYIVTVSTVHYDDNDIIINDSKTRLDKYTRVSSKYRDGWIKSIIRCKDNKVDFMNEEFISFHIPKIEHQENVCNVDGKVNTHKNIWYFGKEENAYLKHIPTGCIDDYVRYKDVRQHINSLEYLGLPYFRAFNDLTPEKEEYYNKHRIRR